MIYTMCASIIKFWMSYGVMSLNISPEISVMSFILIHIIF